MAETDYAGAHTGTEVDDAVGVAKGEGTGLVIKTGTGAGVRRSITSGSAKITVANGNGVAGDPLIDLGNVASTDLSDGATLQAKPSEGAFADGDKTKLDAIESGATADQSGAEIETAYNGQVAQVSAGEKTAGTEVAVRRFSPGDIKDMALAHAGGGLTATDIDTLAELNAIITDATLIDTGDTRLSDARTPTSHSASHTDGTDDIQLATAGQKGLMTTAYATKLDGIEASATADQTGAEIKAAYEAEANTNAFTDAEQSKLSAIEASATADQSGAEIETAYNGQVAQVSAGEKTAGTEVAVRRFSPSDIKDMTITHTPAGGGLEATDIDTLAELNAIITDATLIDTGDARLSDARTPTSHSTSHTDGTDDIQSATAGQKGLMTATQVTKLDGIEASATADQSGAEIKAAYEAEANTNAFTDAEQSKLSAIEASATADQTGAEIKAAYEAEANTNAFTDAEQSKLSAIEASATADQSGAEIKAAYEAEANTNAFTDAEQSKLSAIEASATADQTDAEIRAAVEAATDSNVFTDADHSKLNGIATAATADTPEKQDFTNITGTVAYARASHVGNIIRTSGTTPILNATDEAEIQVNDWFAVRQTDANDPAVNLPAGATANGTPSWASGAVVYYHCVDATGGAYVFDLMGSLA